MQISDVMIHFDENFDTTEKSTIVNYARKIKGVIAPRFNKNKLLVVAYNSDLTKSFNILSRLSSIGYKGKLVGL